MGAVSVNLSKVVGMTIFSLAGLCMLFFMLGALLMLFAGVTGSDVATGMGLGFVVLLWGLIASLVIAAYGVVFWTMGLMLDRLEDMVRLLSPYSGGE